MNTSAYGFVSDHRPVLSRLDGAGRWRAGGRFIAPTICFVPCSSMPAIIGWCYVTSQGGSGWASPAPRVVESVLSAPRAVGRPPNEERLTRRIGVRVSAMALRHVLALVAVALIYGTAHADVTADWAYTEGAPGGGRYSPLADIDRGNVGIAARRHGRIATATSTTAAWCPDHINRGTAFESTPIVVDGRLIFTTPYNRVIALDPESGRELWTFDPRIDRDRLFANMFINRGVAYWRGAERRRPCAQRVFLGTLDARLIALDAATGKPCAELRHRRDRRPARRPRRRSSTPGSTTSPRRRPWSATSSWSAPRSPTRCAASRRPATCAPTTRAAAACCWTFHTIPRPGEFGADTWRGRQLAQCRRRQRLVDDHRRPRRAASSSCR